ncbi:MAG TPA: helix-turn-helix transcriptional regulator [bacterium]|nr:helix-turn-helix transcriptional regulator [bacterium]
MNNIAIFVKEKRHALGLTQERLAEMSGLGIRFIRDLEQGKETLRLDKVNQLLFFFGHTLGPIPVKGGGDGA